MLAALAVAGIVGSSVVATSAMANESTSGQGRMSGLVEMIAQKFNLNQDEVQAVFEQAREEQHAQHQAQELERLEALVEEGTLTQEQKVLITAKQAELKASQESQKESFQDMTLEERQEAMETQKAELEAWAQENGIDITLLQQGRRGAGGPGGRGPGAGMQK